MTAAGNNWQPADPEVGRLRDRLITEVAALAARITAVEGNVRAWQEAQAQAQTERRQHAWQLRFWAITVVALPLAAAAIWSLIKLATG
jgi:hypothetical protein